MKKKLISLILCGVMAFGLVSCGDGKGKETSTNSNKTTTSSTDSSNSKVEAEKSDEEKDNSTLESKEGYRSMTKEEALNFHSEKLYEMESLFNEKGYNAQIQDNRKSDSLGEIPTTVGFKESKEQAPYYNVTMYSSEIKENKTVVKYEFHYYVDKEGIANGTAEIPKARDLLIAEPYKIMTGDEITEELLNEIDKCIEDGFKNGNDDEITLEENGPFKVKVRVDGLDLVFKIISDGDGTGN